MVIALVAITLIFALATVAGFTWILATRGKAVPQRSIATQSAATMEGPAPQPGPAAGPSPVASQAEAGVEDEARRKPEPIAAKIIAAIRAGKFRQVLPPLLAILGLVGVTFFGGLTLIVSATNYLVGLPLIGFSLYTGYLVFSGSMRRR